jgi:hypothetical protein
MTERSPKSIRKPNTLTATSVVMGPGAYSLISYFCGTWEYLVFHRMCAASS